MSKLVRVFITATVEAFVDMGENETPEELKERWIDIYIHGYGPEGMLNKIDLGCDKQEITILPYLREDQS